MRLDDSGRRGGGERMRPFRKCQEVRQREGRSVWRRKWGPRVLVLLCLLSCRKKTCFQANGWSVAGQEMRTQEKRRRSRDRRPCLGREGGRGRGARVRSWRAGRCERGSPGRLSGWLLRPGTECGRERRRG